MSPVATSNYLRTTFWTTIFKKYEASQNKQIANTSQFLTVFNCNCKEKSPISRTLLFLTVSKNTGDRGRTDTSQGTLDFESSASANSATPA